MAAATESLGVAVIYALSRRGIPAASSFRMWVAATLAAAGHHRPSELAIRIVDLDEGRALNQTWRQRDYATNVLSFPVAADHSTPGHSMHLGDLVICAPVVLDEAKAQSKALRAHYAHLCVHGVLHLLGYDHVEESEALQMETLETGILAGLGIDDPYLDRQD